jgi:hypothetical protein
MKLNFFFAAVCLLSSVVNAQIPTPASSQPQAVVLKGGTVHIGNGTVIENGAVKFENGKIVFAGKESELKTTGNEKVVDTKGKHIYPGFIAPNTVLGLVEIEAARPTRDFNEVGDLNPNVRSLIVPMVFCSRKSLRKAALFRARHRWCSWMRGTGKMLPIKPTSAFISTGP